MRIALLALVAACSSSPAPARSKPAPAPAPPVVAAPDPFAAENLGFEEVDGDQPKGWAFKNGAVAAVTDEKHGGARSLRLDGERYALRRLSAQAFIGKRITVRGFLKTQDATYAALWLRADDASGAVAFDNMQGRQLTGTRPWTAAQVTIDVPANAETLVIGAMQVGTGTAWVDDLRVEVAEIKPAAEIELQGTVVDPAGALAATPRLS